MSSSSSQYGDATSMPIAVIGIGLRFPGDGSDPEKFWQMLLDARSGRSEIPKDRYSADGFYHPDSERKGAMNTQTAHFLKQDYKVFDAPFFSITPKEAIAMDPTHRMLLEVTYEGFENAGLTVEAIKGSNTSVYIGTFTNDFQGLQTRDNEGPSIYHATGLSGSLASNRLSWFYDLKGPSLTVDTACSSSLTAFHLGCQSLRTGEAEMSVIGGANLMFGPEMTILLGAAKILSPDGKSQMWDEKANGFSRGEGVGVTVLKPLADAIRDGDNVRAVVLASAVNSDGRTPGISLPSTDAQEELIRTAYRHAGVNPAETGYVEAHGTGTQAGDPLEAAAILNTIGRNRKTKLYVGSVKTNTGHLEGAAGVAGVIKAALLVERGLIPQNLWFDKLNPSIVLPEKVLVPTELSLWPSNGPRRASVNSFGFGGTNAHVILEDAAHFMERTGVTGKHSTVISPQLPRQLLHTVTNKESGQILQSKPRLFALSASDREGVQRVIDQLRTFAEGKMVAESSAWIDDLAYTLGERRTNMPWKSYAIASDIAELISSLDDIPAASRSSDVDAPNIAFVFTGQGAQHFSMGKSLSVFDVYRQSMDTSDIALKVLGCKWNLIEELKRPKEESNLSLAEYSQPICTALQIALVDLLQHWGIKPSAVAGHSSGEIAAAYTAGAITRSSAMTIAWYRGQFATVLASKKIKGAMLAVSADADLIRSKLVRLKIGTAVVGCINSPYSCTVSGDSGAIHELCSILTEDQIPFTRLQVELAYHSPHMELIRDQYEAAISNIRVASFNTLPMFSSVTGALVQPDQLGSKYWADNLTSPVNFVGAIQSLLHHTESEKRTHDRRAFASVFLEVGPHSALRNYLLDIFKTEDKLKDLAYINVLRRGIDAVETALGAVGQLYTKGCDLSLHHINETSSDAKLLMDLPPYPWNHSTVFWAESYLSKEHRFREHARLDLLGCPVPGALVPTWRNFLRVSENPWIKQHQVQGKILYPGAGLMIMAIEGARQVADPNEKISGYELRDCHLSTALVVPDTENGIEVMVQFHPRRTGTKAAPSNTLSEFTISSWSIDINGWQVHCRGLVSVAYESQVTPAMKVELKLDSQKYSDAFAAAQEKCQKPVCSFIYDNIENIGMVYGPVFRNISELYAGDHSSYGTIEVPDTKSTMPASFEYPNVIHPAFLDSVLHLLFPSISGADQSLSEAIVPYSFDRLFISADVPSTPGTKLRGYSTAQKASFTTWTSEIVMATPETSAPMIIFEGLGLASLGATEQSIVTRAQCFETLWHENSDFMSAQQIKELIFKRTIPNADDESVLDKLEYVCLVYIGRILEWFENEGEEHIPKDGFFRLFYQWMQDRMGDFAPLDQDKSKISAELDICRTRISTSDSGDITVQMVDRIGKNLDRIFTKEVEPLQLMIEDDLLYTFYRGAFGTSFNTNVAEYVGLLADQKPGLSILEIGAGTGGTTFHVLERLRGEEGFSRASRYVFTDISPGFLGKAADKFTEDAAIMEFKTCNIENDPISQGFEPESFDLIVAANVLHATKSIDETLAHCYSLLKPGGKLVLSEVTIKRIFCGFIMGTLPGWWLGEEDGRSGGPLLDVDEWNIALKRSNFTGVDIDIRGDRDGSREPVSLLVSTKPAATISSVVSEFAIIGTGDAAAAALAWETSKVFQSHGIEPTLLSWDTFTEAEITGKYCICLAELENSMLANVDEAVWSKFRGLAYNSQGVLWVTSGAAMETTRPFGCLMVGLSRAIRNENANVSLATLDTDPNACVELSAAAIHSVSLNHSTGDSMDHEFAARNGTVFVPRVTKSPNVNKQLLSYESKGELEQISFTGCGRPLKLTIKTPGLLDTFQWQGDELYYEPMPEDWIEIEVKAVGLNFKDVLVAMGNLNDDKLGVDVSGVVTRVGAAVTSIKPGDRVMTATCNAFATFVRFPALGAFDIPEGMSFEDAAALPIISLTAYYSLVTMGRLEAGETVLIHAAAGGVGQAAVGLAQYLGAKVFATVGTEEKKQLLMKEYGIPADQIFSSRDLSFAKAVMRATNGLGVDIVLNSLAGEALRLSWHCLAKFGRFLEIGKADLFANTGLDMMPFLDNKSYVGVNLVDFENNPSPRAMKLWNAVGKLFADGSIRPVTPVMSFTFGEIEKAFRYMQTGKHMGKIVVRLDEYDMVPAVPRTPEVAIRSNATYVLAGGLGGICREIGRWMAEKGAENLVFLSRSAAEGEANKSFIAGLNDTYNTNAMAFNCDVGDKTSLQGVMEKCKNLPPIRGLVTGAMVLQDTLFDSMTFEHLQTTVRPKVHGTWNLHELLPKDMDFFVMLSSLAGVMGHRGQGNYGAGNVFQDYFASYRRSAGLRAMTIDIGYLTSVGFVAENEGYVNHIKSMGLRVMNNTDLSGLMSIAMKDGSHPAQLMVGLPVNEYDDAWYWIKDAKFAALLNRAAGSSTQTSTSASLSSLLIAAPDIATAIDIISDALVQKLAKLMMVPAADIDSARPLSTYGVDSLVAVEVRNWMAKEMLVEVSVFEIMANVPMRQLAADLAGKSRLLTASRELGNQEGEGTRAS